MSEQPDPSQETSSASKRTENSTAANPGPSASEADGSAATPTESAAASSGAASSAAPSDTATAVTEAGGQSPSSTAASGAASPASTQVDVSQLAGASGSPGDVSTASAAADSGVSGVTSKPSSAKSHRSTPEHPGSKVGRGAAEEAPAAAAAAKPKERAPSSKGRSRKRMKLGELDLKTAKIGFLGAGKMAESTINGLIHYAKIAPGQIHVAAPSSKGLERFKALGCHVTKRNYDIFGRYDCDIVFLCFHGYVIKHCYKLGGARPHPLTTNYIPHQRHPVYILSLVSGVSLSQIKACLLNPESTNRYVIEIHRIMMNTAVGHGLGICAIDCEPDSKKLSAPLRQLMSSIAQLEHVPASQMDAACAIGGSGLAFSYYFINALADGAFKMGLSRQQAIRFASKTASCAAQTMLESGKHPAELRDNVSSPSGAAIYGIHVLEKNDVASGVTAAVEAAHKRANDLATQEMS